MTERWLAVAVVVTLACVPSVGTAGDGVVLADVKEVLKLRSKVVPPNVSARPFVRFSPNGKRCLYIRMYAPGKAKIHLRLVDEAKSDSPVPWDVGMSSLYCQMGLSQFVWRADGQRALFLHPKLDDKGEPIADCHKTLTPWAMCWDLKNPQCSRMQFPKPKAATGCTSLSYSPAGKVLYMAACNLGADRFGAVVRWDAAARRGRTLCSAKGKAVYHLAVSPDGKCVAFVEFRPRGRGRWPEVVVLNAATGKQVRRVGLSVHIPGWPDAHRPVWSADSKTLYYGDVANVDRRYRREVRALTLADGKTALLARDAIAVGPAPGGLIANRGPRCIPMAQSIRSFIPPDSGDLPRTNDVVFVARSGKASPAVLVPNAHAEHVVGATLYYRVPSGPDIIVMRATVKPAPAKRPGS